MTTTKTLNHGTPFRQKHFTDYDQEMLTALYRTIGYLGEQGTSTPALRKALCNEITKIEDKAKEDEATDEMDFNCKASPCHY